jgi:O-antigen ligase
MNRKKFIPLIIVVSIVFAAFSSNLIDRYLNIVNVYAQEEVVEAAPVEDRSTSIRLNVEWPRALRALNKNPITGLGYSSITLATDNDYLRMLGETGIFGLLAFILVLGSIVLEMFKKFPKPGSILPEDLFLAGIFAALPGILLNMVFIDILEASKFAILFWLLMGFGVYIAVSKKNG